MPEHPPHLVKAAEEKLKQGLHGGVSAWREFKAFAVKGNVIDLAVAVIIGAAFTGVVNSLVKDIITPPLTLLTGGLNFSNKFMVLKSGTNGLREFATPELALADKAIPWTYGAFLTTLINFFFVSLAIFLLVRAISRLKKPDAPAPVSKDCPFCAMTIPIAASRCPHCTSQLAAGEKQAAAL